METQIRRFQPKDRCRDAEESAEIFASRQENASFRGKTVRDAEKNMQISASRKQDSAMPWILPYP